jgi:Tfp pilus assembly PilM family ATPase
MPLSTVDDGGAFEDWMRGQHVVNIDSDQVVFNVIDIETYSDALGAFYAWGLDDDGDWRDPSTLREDVAVLDVGYSALRLSVLQGGDLVHQRLENFGTGFFADFMKIWLLNRRDYSLEIFEADKLLYAERPQIHTANGPEGLLDMVSRARHALETEVEALLDWKTFEHVILTGGGALLLSAQDPITDRHRQAHVLDEPITAIVRGLASYIALTDRRQ